MLFLLSFECCEWVVHGLVEMVGMIEVVHLEWLRLMIKKVGMVEVVEVDDVQPSGVQCFEESKSFEGY